MTPEERFQKIENTLNRSAEVQAQTDLRIDRLIEAMTKIAEAQDRAERKLERLLKQSGLPGGKTLGNLDEGKLPAKVRRVLPSLLDGAFVTRAENVMALPCSRAWLDLHRFVVEACVGLGEPYNAIAVAIRTELKALLRDMPRLQPLALLVLARRGPERAGSGPLPLPLPRRTGEG